MTARVLVVNSGSSSLKWRVVDVDDDGSGATTLGRGLIERIGDTGGCADHAVAVAVMLDDLASAGVGLPSLTAVGHRVVHGGARFTAPTLLDDDVVEQITALVPLAPLHNPANLVGIADLRAVLPDLPHVAVFDTAFHATIPDHAATYALPTALAAEHGIRRYGFHGTSHAYVTRRTAELLGIPVDQANLVIAHIGNGASVTAVSGGRSVDTSMGLTPLEGLVMGTRSGDLDPGILFHLARTAGLDIGALDRLVNKESGLKGMAGTGDMRSVRALAAEGDPQAVLALEVYAYRLRKYVAAYLGVVPGVRAVVFTAGVGENDAVLRADVADGLRHLGLHLDPVRNAAPVHDDRVVSADGSPVLVLVIGTDEEGEIAREVALLVAGRA